MEFLRALTLVSTICVGSVYAFQNQSIEEVVEKQSPLCVRTKKNIFLTEKQLSKVAKLAKSKMPSALVLKYDLDCKEEKLSAYVHSDIVRTLNQTLVIIVDSKNKVKVIKRAIFLEPHEYLAPVKWLTQYLGKTLKDDLEIRQEIDALSGATLTARSTNDAVRRILALHQVLK